MCVHFLYGSLCPYEGPGSDLTAQALEARGRGPGSAAPGTGST